MMQESTGRKLRLSSNSDNVSLEVTTNTEGQDSLRAIRINNAEIEEKALQYSKMQAELAAKKKAFEQEIAGLQKTVDALKDELLAYGRENGIDCINASDVTLTFTSRTKREINPKSLLVFLNNLNKAKDFYTYINVPITKVIKNFGESLLVTSGILKSSLDEYAGIKVE